MRTKMMIGIAIAVVTLLLTGIVALRLQTEDIVVASQFVPVQTMTAGESSYDEVLTYIGGVTSDSIQMLSFKSSGRVDTVHVVTGQRVDQDSLLVSLDTEDLGFQLAASESTMNAAKAQYDLAVKGTRAEDLEMARLTMEKAREVSVFKADTLSEMEVLFEGDYISSKELEGAGLEATVAELDYNNAKQLYEKALAGPDKETLDGLLSQYEQAVAGYEHTLSLMNDSQLYATTSGTVVDIMNEENEMVQAGYPVVVIREDNQVIEMGVTDEDLRDLSIGQQVIITGETQVGEGTINRISDVPDRTTHLYEVEVSIEGSDIFLVGEIVQCDIVVGSFVGIDIPMSAVMIDDVNYVYVDNDGIATKRTIEIMRMMGERVIVEGLTEGDQIITENVSKLFEGKGILVLD